MNQTIQQIAEAVGQKNQSNQLITQVEFDSRKISEGSLFVPLAGERDGHEFIQQAIENGAVAAFWSWDLEKAPKEIEIIPVNDTLAALQQLAKVYLKQVGAEVIGVTGSNGKTTTKDLIASVLAQKFRTYKTQGNYNNDIGLPYTILHMPEDTEKLVLEMGMDHAGEISVLSALAEPQAAAITMIGEAHIENLGSREGIAKAKMEITQGLAEDGLLLIPETEPLLRPLVAPLVQEIKTFGIKTGDIAGEIISEEKEETKFKVDGHTLTIPMPGSYNVTNALIAYTFGLYFGLSVEEIKQGLTSVSITQNRTQWLSAGNGASILSDVYNANPTAMGLVLDTFKKLPTSGKRIAVLADMLELGSDSAKLHAQMSEHLDAEHYQAVFLYGPEMEILEKTIQQNHPEIAVHYFKENKNALITQLKNYIQPDDSIVLKGSNSMGLLEVVEALVNMEE